MQTCNIECKLSALLLIITYRQRALRVHRDYLEKQTRHLKPALISIPLMDTQPTLSTFFLSHPSLENLSSLFLAKNLDGLVVNSGSRFTRVLVLFTLTLIEHVVFEVAVDARLIGVGEAALLLEVAVPKVVAVA
jgi:hypothetical protein